MYDIIVAVDRDEDRARRQAASVASLPGSDSVHAILTHVFTDNPEGATIGQLSSVRAARERLEAADIEVTLVGDSGDPAERILAIADERNADAISVCGRKRSPAGKVLFGSVTQAILLESPHPVLVAGNGGTIEDD